MDILSKCSIFNEPQTTQHQHLAAIATDTGVVVVVALFLKCHTLVFFSIFRVWCVFGAANELRCGFDRNLICIRNLCIG